MNRYMVVKTEDLLKLLECFSTQAEFTEFGEGLACTIDEIVFTGNVVARNMDKKEFVSLMTMKQIFIFALFCRDNMDTIHDLVSKIEYEEVTEEVKKELEREFPKGDLDRMSE